MPFVEIYRVRRFLFRRTSGKDNENFKNDDVSDLNASTENVLSDPSVEHSGQAAAGAIDNEMQRVIIGSQWNCDGEVLTEADIDVE